MSRPVQLIEFENAVLPGARGQADESVLSEEQKLAAFEAGYAAGWDDAIKAKSDDSEQVSAEFAQNLQDLAFTYHEARAQVLRDLRPLFEELTAKVLPKIAQDNLGELVIEQLLTIANDQPQSEIKLKVNPLNEAAIADLLAKQSHLSVTPIGDLTLGEGQAVLQFADRQSRIDLGAILEEVSGKFDDFYALDQKVD